MRPRDNPFSVQRIHELPGYVLTDTTWEALIARLSELRWRGAIVGPMGHGKSTLLHSLADRLAEQGWTTGWIQLREDKRRLDADDRQLVDRLAREQGLLCVDGAEQLSPFAWYGLRRRSRACGGFLVTTHLPGRLPTLYTCRTSPDLLSNLVGTLTSRTPLPVSVDLPRLHQRHHGNIRDAFRHLYDLCADL